MEKCIMDEKRISVYFIGNTGVGKSFLANCLVGEPVFESKAWATSVTRETGIAISVDKKYCVYNLPGLLEAKVERTRENVEQIKKTFNDGNPSLIFFVLLVVNGRVTPGDAQAYKAFAEAYSLGRENCIFLVNLYPGYRTVTKGMIELEIQRTLEDRKVMFIPSLTGVFEDDCPTIRACLAHAIQDLVPTQIQNKQELTLQSEEIKKLIAEWEEKEKLYREELEANKLEKEIRDRDEKQAEKEKQVMQAIAAIGMIAVGASGNLQAAALANGLSRAVEKAPAVLSFLSTCREGLIPALASGALSNHNCEGASERRGADQTANTVQPSAVQTASVVRPSSSPSKKRKSEQTHVGSKKLK